MTIKWDDLTSSSSSSSTSVAALTVIEPPTGEQTIHIQIYHNAIVGHNGVDRALTWLFRLNQVWKIWNNAYVSSYEIVCCQKLSTVDARINAAHFLTSTHAIFDTLNINYVGPFPD